MRNGMNFREYDIEYTYSMNMHYSCHTNTLVISLARVQNRFFTDTSSSMSPSIGSRQITIRMHANPRIAWVPCCVICVRGVVDAVEEA